MIMKKRSVLKKHHQTQITWKRKLIVDQQFWYSCLLKLHFFFSSDIFLFLWKTFFSSLKKLWSHMTILGASSIAHAWQLKSLISLTNKLCPKKSNICFWALKIYDKFTIIFKVMTFNIPLNLITCGSCGCKIIRT